ncbi:23S rRNA (uracil(1939)-C(5))-methyltransferase RlmD [Mesobacillus zeae]|uniref:23S rRNA (Uracil(1939)-C(5))-methyltransferase RlmD n=1 Tax=Mesobacillus zeae TaxID=1917180 RepID=A0A398AY11_9BACI|nr:23S rRNA (uracil(1939)-C(5))-methyltransferase RlmD [Mesobacillus zeae]RID82507.1 23S rRNA (uracil(1939)-C(5))-methyltransferase RlmD [Mesobacillus zeae]
MDKSIPVEKNDCIEAVCEDLTHDGSGVVKIDGYPIFVPGVLPGEKASIKIIKVNKGYGFGKLVDILERSPFRVDVSPEEAHKYGGCQLQHISYEGQLNSKENLVRQAMARIGKLENAAIHPVLGMENPWNYRNKAQVPVGQKDGKLIAGFYKPRSHEIIDTDESLIHLPEVNEAIKVVKEICSKLEIQPFNEEKHTGILRHIMARYGKESGELMIILVTRISDLPHKSHLVEKILAALPNVRSIIQNINTKKTNVILGEKTKVLWGSDVIYDNIGDVKFAISPLSFYQVNPVSTKVLYDKALEYAGLTGKETVIDAYCGIGTISLFMAKKAKKVYGVEIVPDAVKDAKRNASLNGITNAKFEAGLAETVIPKWYEEGIVADVFVVDPPRKGCDSTLLETIIEMKPKKVVYVSCNPATLARDLRILEDGGYQTKQIQPVDMFPHTTHVECVAEIVLK